MNQSVRSAVIALALVAGLGACKPEPSTQTPEPRTSSSEPGVLVEAQPPEPQCLARTSRGALALIPDRSDWIIHVGPRELLGSELWALVGAEIAQDSEWLEVEQVFGACGIALAQLDHVLVGLDASEQFVVLFSAPTIGRPDVAQCVIREIQALANDPQIASVIAWDEDPSVPIVEFTDGRAYLFADDLLAIATTQWQAEVGRLSRCEGEPATAGTSRDRLRRVDVNAPVWATGRITPGVASELDGILGLADGSASEAAMSLRVDDGAAVLGHLQMRDAGAAASFADSIRAMQTSFGSLLGPELAPAIQRASVETVGAELLLRFTLTGAELRSLSAI